MVLFQVKVNFNGKFEISVDNINENLDTKWVILSTWQQFRKKQPLKKIARTANLSTVMAMCRCSDM